MIPASLNPVNLVNDVSETQGSAGVFFRHIIDRIARIRGRADSIPASLNPVDLVNDVSETQGSAGVFLDT